MQPQAPAPDMVTAARRHLSTEFAQGVDRLLWDLEKRPMPDVDAINALLSAAKRSDRPVEALSTGAALVLLQSLRLELDGLEADVFDAALASGVGYDSLAAVLDLPDAAAAQCREQYLKERRDLPRAPARSPLRHDPVSHGAAEAAAQAGRRADQAASRAAIAGRRREELRQAPRESRIRRADADQAAAHASEARVQAGDAAERVATGLLRAAAALDRCAARCEELRQSSGDPNFTRRAQEYSRAAQRYREMAGNYSDIGKRM
jgi:hypothetical protein